MLRDSFERPIQIVEDGNQVRKKRRYRILLELFFFFDDALAKVHLFGERTKIFIVQLRKLRFEQLDFRVSSSQTRLRRRDCAGLIFVGSFSAWLRFDFRHQRLTHILLRLILRSTLSLFLLWRVIHRFR